MKAKVFYFSNFKKKYWGTSAYKPALEKIIFQKIEKITKNFQKIFQEQVCKRLYPNIFFEI